jgi:hypothetical protein
VCDDNIKIMGSREMCEVYVGVYIILEDRVT